MKRIPWSLLSRVHGLSLLELLVVVAIAGSTFAASLAFASKAMHVSARAQSVAKATVLARNELDFWKAQSAEKLLALKEGEQPFGNPAAALPENAVDRSTLRVRRVEPGIVELTATVGMAGESNYPLNVKLTEWLATGE